MRIYYSIFSSLRSYSASLLLVRRTIMTTASNGDIKTGNVFERLPTNAKPKNYNIHLTPDLTNFVFSGVEKIKFEVLKPLNELKINSKDIAIQNATLKVGNNEYKNLATEYNERWNTVTFKCPVEIAPGDAELDLSFTGILNDQMKGFYRSKWVDSDKKDQYMATTQFESTSARMAFPCWDEPMLKATFDFALTVPKDKVAISCMDVISSEEKGDSKIVRFDTTPIMSTYLLAFAIGDLEFIEGKTSEGTRVRIYTTPGKSSQGKFALDVCLKALPFYSKYFGIPFMLPKCDLIAIPDYNMGAMENWGLVTYREVYLLHDEKHSSASGKENIALVVGHELAHMWFGNLVTMEWWTDLWLKEGYAVFMEYYFVNTFFPEFDIWTAFINQETLSSMKLDALKSSHPIEVPINDPDEIDEIYDGISYAKSSSIIRMLHAYLGNETFQKGLSDYLKKYAYKNAVTLDLWSALSESSGQEVAKLMKNWTLKMGYPVVKVSEQLEGDKRILLLDQERFIADGSSDPDKTLWQVLVTISSASKPDGILQRALLGDKTMKVVVENAKPGEWLKLNTMLSGYYRVQYSDQMLKALIPAVTSQTLKPADRFNIVNDLFALVCAGKASTTQYLDVISNMKNEEDYNVLSDISASISTIANVLQRTDDLSPKFDAFCCKLFEKLGDKYGWDAKEGEGHVVNLLRPLILGVLGRCGHPKYVEEAKKRFDDHVSGKRTLPADLRRKVFGIVVKNNGVSAFESLKQLFETSDFSEFERDCMISFGQNKDVELQTAVWEYALNGGKVRLQDLYIVCAGLVSTMEGQNTMWKYVSLNFDGLLERFGTPSNVLFQHILKMSIRSHCSDEFVVGVEKFFETCPQKVALNRPVAQSIENVKLNASLLKKDENNIRKWLNDHGY